MEMPVVKRKIAGEDAEETMKKLKIRKNKNKTQLLETINEDPHLLPQNDQKADVRHLLIRNLQKMQRPSVYYT